MRVMSSKSFFESLQESLQEEVNGAPKDANLIFDSEDEIYRDDSPEAEADFDADFEGVTSLIDDQVNEYLILNGYNKTWDRGGDGYKVKESLSDLIGNYDGIRVYKNNDGGIDLYLYDHDGYTSGTLYTFKKDSDDEIEKVLQEYFEDDDISLYYFLDWVDAGVLKLLQEKGLLVPLKANGVLGESDELEPKFANRKSFYGKAHVDTLEDGTKVLTSYDTKVASVKDGKVSVLCDKEDLTATTLRHIDEFLKQCGVKSLPKKELVKLIDEKGLKESDEDFESYDDFSDGDIIKDVVDNFKEITGKDVKEVFNFEITGNDADGYFKQEVVDETGDKIIDYWKEKGLDRSRIDDLLYKLDDELQSKWWDYFTESVDKETGKEVLLGNDKTNEKCVAFGLKASDKMLEQDSTVRVYKNSDSEREYSIVDITELNEINDGDVQPPIDVAGLLTEVDSRLTESYGNWGTINLQSTRFNKETNDSNALFELNVGKDTYLMSMLLEENCSVLKVNNTNGKTIFKRKSNDVVGLAESYIKQFVDGKEANEIPECIKHISDPLHERLAFIKSYIDMVKLAPKEEKEAFNEYIQKEIYEFIAEVSDEIKSNEPTDEEKLELPTFDKMVEEVFGKEWVKEVKEPETKEVAGTETLTESNKTEKEYRIIDTKTNKVLKTFKADEQEKGYLEMRKMGEELKKSGKEDNLIYKEFTVKLKESDKPEESVFTSFRPSGQEEGLIGRLWFNIDGKSDTIDLFYNDGKYDLIYGTFVPDYIKEFIDNYGGYDKFVDDALKYVQGLKESTLNESFYVKVWNDAAEDYDDYAEYKTKEEAQKEVDALKKNGEKAIIETFSEKSRDPELSAEVDYYNKTFNEGNLPNISEFIYNLDVDKGNAWSAQSYTQNGKGDKIIIVSRNGQSENTAEDIVKAVEEKYPKLKGEPTINGRSIWFYLKEDSLNEDEVEDKVAEPKQGLGTGNASFVRKPSNIEDLDNKAKYFTDGEASYLIVDKKELSKDEFDKIQDNFLSDNEYCKSFEPLDTDNYSFNVIEFTCKDYDYKLLVDPSGFSYCRYVAKVGGNE